MGKSMTTERGKRKVRIGVVLSDRMDKTRVVGVEWSQVHPLYQRRVRRFTRFKVHDQANEARAGDRVRIVETRPLSKGKRWRIVEIIERAEAVEVRPEEVDTTLLKELEEKPEAPALAGAPAEAPIAAGEAPAPPETEELPRARGRRAGAPEAEAPPSEAPKEQTA